MAKYLIIETIVYIISSRDDFSENELKEIASQISDEGGDLIMTLAKRLIEQGIEQGIERGIEQGELKKAKKMAINFLKMGLPVERVAKGTELTIEEVEELKKKMLN